MSSPLAIILIAAAVLLLVGLGFLVGQLLARSRRDAEQEAIGEIATQLAARNHETVEGVVDRLVAMAGTSLDTRLTSGTAELEHRRVAIDRDLIGAQKRMDERLDEVVKALQIKIDTVDQVVTERVGGLSEVVGERVGGMSDNLGHQVTAMGTELHQVRTLVAQLQKERVEQHGQLVTHLEAATRQQSELSATTSQLREALASPQARGQWGERMAEDVLRAAGMREGINYRKQMTIAGGNRPDFTFLLPDDQRLHMDVKFPVTNYMRYLEAPSDAEANTYRQQFLRDVRDRVKELTGRGYAASDTTVGYLLLFIPNESVFGFIHEHDGGLLDDALGQRVVLCSPTTLFAVLAVVRQAMDTFAVERATEEILECLGGFSEQWEKFSGAVDKVERHLETLNNSFTDLAGTRRRALVRKLAAIDEIRERTEVDADADVGELDLPAPLLRDVAG